MELSSPRRLSVGPAPERVKRGLARRPIPVLRLARLAVDARFRGESRGT